MQARDLMATNVITASPDATLEELARLMKDKGVGSVVLLDGKKIAGIFTERDFLRTAAAGLQPRSTAVREHMSAEIQSISPRTDVVEAGRLLADRGFRHLPVVEKGELVGILSMRDLLNWSVREMHTADELAQVEKGQEVLSVVVEGSNNGT